MNDITFFNAEQISKKILITVLCFLAFCSCSKTKESSSKSTVQSEIKSKENLNSAGVKEEGNEFSVEYEQPRKIYKIEKEDLNNDGSREIIVMSIKEDSSDKYNDFFNFDMIEVFTLNKENKKYIKILSDTVDYSKEYFFESLSGDSRKQMFITTDTGGNDSVTSRGMFVYEMESENKINLLKYFDTGAPGIFDLKNNGQKEILVSDLFYGVMPQDDAVDFIKEIYKLEGSSLVLKNSEFPEFFDKKIRELSEEYSEIKRKNDMGMQMEAMAYPLYRQAAEIIVNYFAKGDFKGLQKFWDEEKDYLQIRIPGDEFTDLNNFVLKAIPTATNA